MFDLSVVNYLIYLTKKISIWSVLTIYIQKYLANHSQNKHHTTLYNYIYNIRNNYTFVRYIILREYINSLKQT